ncbi:MAG TPA: fumarylacetoacetate hydrolase family protein [Gemmatimonadaceae bacterium]|nr:fumarylacetoacetate hydrolase family protein [Gemmatimonadaceae bacterium]
MKIVCVGRNYADHAKEMGNDVPAEPLIFLKPPSSLLAPGAPIVLPPQSQEVHFEGEIGVFVGQRMKSVTPEVAQAGIAGLAAANDVTARDLQRRDSQWARAKGFDTFCPVGPQRAVEGLDDLELVTRVNGEVRQRARSNEMIFPIPQILSYISHIMTLEPGDLVLTGTPAGVGRLVSGDEVEVEVVGVGKVRNPVTDTGG